MKPLTICPLCGSDNVGSNHTYEQYECRDCGNAFSDFDIEEAKAAETDEETDEDFEDDGQPSELQENEDFSHDNDWDYESGTCDE